MKGIKSDPVKTVLTITVGFLILHLVFIAPWLLLVSLIIGVIGIASTRLSRMIDFAWMKLTFVLSLIVPNILLSIIFYLFLFPVSMISKLFSSKDPLRLKNNNLSVFKTVNKEFEPSSFENPW